MVKLAGVVLRKENGRMSNVGDDVWSCGPEDSLVVYTRAMTTES